MATDGLVQLPLVVGVGEHRTPFSELVIRWCHDPGLIGDQPERIRAGRVEKHENEIFCARAPTWSTFLFGDDDRWLSPASPLGVAAASELETHHLTRIVRQVDNDLRPLSGRLPVEPAL